MYPGLRFRGVGGVVMLALVAGGTFADDPTAPLYTVENGRRVPTYVIAVDPGRPTAPSGQLALLTQAADAEKVPPTTRDALGKADESERAGDEGPRVIVRDHRYAGGRYAGYPVSFVRLYDQGSYGSYPYDPLGVQKAIEEAYFAGRYDEQLYQQRDFNRRDMQARKERLLTQHEQVLRTGVECLRQGRYNDAIAALTMAGELNNGDPACRIHLAQARLALGHYDEAGEVLRRALELQPKLVYVQLHLEQFYSDPRVFNEQVDQLIATLKKRKATANEYFLLGFFEFQRGNLETAYRAFREVARVWRDDPQVTAFLEITRPATN